MVTDDILYHRYLGGDEDGLSALMERHGDKLTLYLDGCLHDLHESEDLMIEAFAYLEMSRNVQSGNTQNLKSTVIQRSFPKWSVAERRKTAAASDQAAVCACAHSRYFAGGSPSGLRV